MGQWLEVPSKTSLYIRKTGAAGEVGGELHCQQCGPRQRMCRSLPGSLPALGCRIAELDGAVPLKLFLPAQQKLLVEAKAVLAVDLILLLFKSVVKLS